MGVKLGDIQRSVCNMSLFSNEQEVAELEQSIKDSGLINKIILRKAGNDVECIAGMKRVNALLNQRGPDSFINEETECTLLEDCSDKEALNMSIDENTRRYQNSAIELAEVADKLYSMLGDSKYRNPSNVAKRLNISETRASMLLEMKKDQQIIPDSLKRELIKPPSQEPLCDERHWHILRKYKEQPEIFDQAVETLMSSTCLMTLASFEKSVEDIKSEVEADNSGSEENSGEDEKPEKPKKEKKKKNTVTDWKFSGDMVLKKVNEEGEEVGEDEEGEMVLQIGPDKIDFAAMKERIKQYRCVAKIRIDAYARSEEQL